MKKTDRLGWVLLMKNPKAMRKLETLAPNVPNCKIAFFPNLESRYELIIDVISCSILSIEGKIAL